MKLAQIHTLLDSIKGTTFAGMDTITDVKLKGGKKNPMQGRVTKHCTGHQVLLFTDMEAYTKRVNRRLEAEGKPATFTAAARAWGTRIDNSPLIEHNGKFYLQVDFQRSGTVQYFLDNKPIDKADIEGLDEKEQTSGRQGLEDENAVVIRTFALDSIREIRMMGETVKG